MLTNCLSDTVVVLAAYIYVINFVLPMWL